MQTAQEVAALVALLRAGRQSWTHYTRALAETRNVVAMLDDELGLFAAEAQSRAAEEIAAWSRRGIQVVSILDSGYPENLGRVADRPPLLFVAGALSSADCRSVAVVGARRANASGLRAARRIAECLSEERYTVVSGLAAGIDAEAHRAALEAGGRTVGVIGTGLDHSYPPENAKLQQRVAAEGALVSQFWPATAPSRRTFPMRNAVMSGLTLATVIVDASETSGTRIQARFALAQGRPVLLLGSLLSQPWAQELARRPGVEVVHTGDDVVAALRRRQSGELVAEH